MQLNPRQLLTQFGHVLQQSLFPAVEAETGELSSEQRLLASVLSLIPLEKMLSARRAPTGRRARDRAALATAFLAKAILNLTTTRELMARLRVDEALRRLCGWRVRRRCRMNRNFREHSPNSPRPGCPSSCTKR